MEYLSNTKEERQVPVYTYRAKAGATGCSDCAGAFEIRQKIDEEKLSACPRCGGPVERIITTCNFMRGYSAHPLSSRRLKQAGFKKLAKDEGGNYVDVT